MDSRLATDGCITLFTELDTVSHAENLEEVRVRKCCGLEERSAEEVSH
jgi:hypothetical protein